MSTVPLVKIQAATASEICARFDLKPEARRLLREEMAPGEFVTALLENKQYVTGIDFLAHALPAREGVWWGCLCMQHACGDHLSAPERAAGIAAVRWVLQPTEENGEAAKVPAETAGATSPAGSLAMAANQTGGSLAPTGAPAVPAAPSAPAKGIATAIKVACTKGDPAKILDTQRLYVNLGLEVAEGRII